MRDAPPANPELFDRFRAGDAEAFRELIGPHGGALEACARRRLDPRIHKRVSVADVVQDAHVVAFERHADFRGDCHADLRKWLLGIVANRVRKAVERHANTDKRAIGHEITRGDRPSTQMLRGPEGTPSQAFAAKELAALAAEARVVLTKSDEELLHLVHDERLSLKDAAERLGRTHEAVRKQHARALRRLGSAFRRLCGDRGEPI